MEIREEGTFVRYGTVEAAIAAAEARAGLVTDPPTKLPNGDYRLIYVDSAIPIDAAGSGTVVMAYQDRGDRGGSWFWASQGPPLSISVPPGLPEVETGVPGATVWYVGGPAEPVGGNVRHMQFIARTAQYDRFLRAAALLEVPMVSFFEARPADGTLDTRREGLVGQPAATVGRGSRRPRAWAGVVRTGADKLRAIPS
ncbi:hypothetical protein EDM76_08775 [bacterium]|nr:MAG: hypothetical protein EDM76_08775 [bacterium]